MDARNVPNWGQSSLVLLCLSLRSRCASVDAECITQHVDDDAYDVLLVAEESERASLMSLISGRAA